jgi:hypothetical protein
MELAINSQSLARPHDTSVYNSVRSAGGSLHDADTRPRVGARLCEFSLTDN